MKQSIYYLLFLSLFFGSLQAQLSPEKSAMITDLEKNQSKYVSVAEKIWSHAELGFLEDESSALLQKTLKKAGFSIKADVAGMPTAFIAEYGSGKPIIAMLAEYDALPDMSQKAVPMKVKSPNGSAGHACGHHLFGAGSIAAAITVKNWLKETKTPGTIRLYGTPAEEGGGGKVFMVRSGLFDDVDAVLSWHPGNENSADAGSSLAAISARFRFKGVAAHAAGAPWMGRSALDGVEAMNYMVNMMREHVKPESRIHYAILNGAKAANIVPAEAEASYIIRHPDMREVRQLFARVVKASEAAAMGTETEVSHEIIIGYFNKLPNQVLGEAMHKNLQLVGGVSYDAKEKDFAAKLMDTYDSRDLMPESAEKVKEFEVIEIGRGGSTDVGDISWVRPTTGMRAATWAPGTSAHSWQAVAAGGMSIGHKGMMVAAKTLSLTAFDLFNNPELLEKANEELLRRRGADFKYESLLGDREPPLDYRKGQE
ncbi:MAG: amidohydrolase [Bacteroidia bacterium]|nr:amidohydrolase [Bacteroidia bacterium]